jgi:hypothetical protein
MQLHLPATPLLEASVEAVAAAYDHEAAEKNRRLLLGHQNAAEADAPASRT